MTPSPQYLLDQLAAIDASPASGLIWIAYSGGIDSHVLLQLAVDAGLNQNSRLRAVHIHHGLDPAADGWAGHCQSVCDRLGVECQVHRVIIAGSGSLEDRARQARYQVFEDLLGDADLLLQGHHANDQAETVLLRLMRGSGVRGLAAIPQKRQLGLGRLVRPLLACRREQLQCYAQQRGLVWIEDPSNADSVHDRNYLRANVMPMLSDRWPMALQSMTRSAVCCSDAQRLNQDLAVIDISECLHADRQAGIGLAIEPLSRLADYRRDNLLRYWLHQEVQWLPDERQLQQLWSDLVGARQDAQPLFQVGRWQLRRFDAVLYLVADVESIAEASEQQWQLAADGSGDIAFAGGQLRSVATVGEGLLLPPSRQLQLRLRQGGERIRLPGRVGSRSLKKLLQHERIPPWLRQRLPLVYLDNALVSVAGLWIADGYQALPEQAGIKLSWRASAESGIASAEGDF